ncbi:hypothetical protein Esti_004914 [Eimeria stiedai]
MEGLGGDRRADDSPPASTVSSTADENRRGIELAKKQQNVEGVHALDVKNGEAPSASLGVALHALHLSRLSKTGAASASPSFRVPRWAIICIYCIYGFLTGAAYFNWTPMADMLYADGAFAWTCSASSLEAFEREGVPRSRPRCVAQELAVGRLFSAMSASEFAFSALAGVLFDSLGPKLTACIGTLMALAGWTLLAVGSQTLNTFVAASVFLGGSSEMCFYPMLPAANLYPGRESTVMAVFGAFRSISFVIPLVLRAVNVEAGLSSFRNALLGFACICTAGCFLLALLFVPRKAWLRPGEAEALERKEEAEEGGVSWTALRASASSFVREACSLAFAPMAAAYTLVVLTIMFYVPSTLHLIPDAYSANQVIQIFSFLPCPLLGYAADRLGILWVMQFINLCGFAAYFSAATPSIPTYPLFQYSSAVFSALQVSFMNSQLYCYGAKYLSQRNLGKLIGSAFCLAGFVSLVTNPMRGYALRRGFRPVCFLLMGLSVVVALILGALQLLEARQSLRKEKKEVQQEQLEGAVGEEARANVHAEAP